MRTFFAANFRMASFAPKTKKSTHDPEPPHLATPKDKRGETVKSCCPLWRFGSSCNSTACPGDVSRLLSPEGRISGYLSARFTPVRSRKRRPWSSLISSCWHSFCSLESDLSGGGYARTATPDRCSSFLIRFRSRDCRAIELDLSTAFSHS
jgi:hypothetical protein